MLRHRYITHIISFLVGVGASITTSYIFFGPFNQAAELASGSISNNEELLNKAKVLQDEPALGLLSPNEVNRTEAKVNQQLIDDIFRGLDPFRHPPNIKPDWTYPHTNWHPLFFEHMWTKYIKPNHGEIEFYFYLEVGSFKGGSIVRLAELLKAKYPNWRRVSLVCMDPFTGDVNMWDWNQKKKTQGHNFLSTGPNGRPQIFEIFMANLIDKGHQDMVLPIVVGGLVGMKVIDRLKRQGRIEQLPGVIYLDSAHEKDETYLELEQAWAILQECGAIIGDDWVWEAVRNDAMRFAKSRQLAELPLYAYAIKGNTNQQPVPGLILGPKDQWFIIKNGGRGCKFDADGMW